LLDFTERLFHHLAHRFTGIKLWLLWQITDFNAGHGASLTLKLFIHASHNAQQGGFARAV